MVLNTSVTVFVSLSPSKLNFSLTELVAFSNFSKAKAAFLWSSNSTNTSVAFFLACARLLISIDSCLKRANSN